MIVNPNKSIKTITKMGRTRLKSSFPEGVVSDDILQSPSSATAECRGDNRNTTQTTKGCQKNTCEIGELKGRFNLPRSLSRFDLPDDDASVQAVAGQCIPLQGPLQPQDVCTMSFQPALG